eukprot:365421-Chlamydomonas_euryale.AAC.5
MVEYILSATGMPIRPWHPRKNHTAHKLQEGTVVTPSPAPSSAPLPHPSPPPHTSIPQPRVSPLCELSPRACISHQPGLALPRGGRACDMVALQ